MNGTHIIPVPRLDLSQVLVKIKRHQPLRDDILLQNDDIPIGDLARHVERGNGRRRGRQCEREETECEDGCGEHCSCIGRKGGNGGEEEGDGLI